MAVQNVGCFFTYFCGGYKNNFWLQFRSSFIRKIRGCSSEIMMPVYFLRLSKSTLMQIWKFHCMFGFIWKQCPEKFAFLILRILDFLPVKFAFFLKTVGNDDSVFSKGTEKILQDKDEENINFGTNCNNERAEEDGLSNDIFLLIRQSLKASVIVSQTKLLVIWKNSINIHGKSQDLWTNHVNEIC